MAALAESLGLDFEGKEREGFTPLLWNYLPLPVTLRLEVPLTDEELIRFSRAHRPYRMERNAAGELEIMSPTGWDGSEREEFASSMLREWTRLHGGHARGATAGFKLRDDSIRSPDACWVSEERVARLTAVEKRKYAPFCPDFVIEVRSETDSRRVLEQKMQLWLDAGAQLAWMIDPFQRDVTIFRPGCNPERLERPEWVEADSVVKGFRLETAQMWDESPRD